MAMNAVDSSGRFTAEYAAYTKLSIGNWIQRGVNGNWHEPKKSITFQEFMDAIMKEQVVNKNYARQIPIDEVQSHTLNSRNSEHSFAQRQYSILERAYELGLADFNGILISSFEAKV